MTQQKIRLLVERNRKTSFISDRKIIPLRDSQPYYRSRKGLYVHVIRSGAWHIPDADWRKPYATYKFWCGAIGSSSKGIISANVPDGRELCATCEGRAIGAGFYGVRKINGMRVIFAPRDETGG